MLGWIKISYGIQRHWLWEKPLYLKWWLDLLLSAAWKETKQLVGTTLVAIQRGQLLASVSTLREKWRYQDTQGKTFTPAPNTILKFLNSLENDGMITRSKSMPNRITLITIVNYDEYQQNTTTDSTPLNNAPNNTFNNTFNNTTPYIKEEYKNIHTNAHTHARGAEDFQAELQADTLFFDNAAMALHADRQWLLSLIPKFHYETQAIQKQIPNYNEYRREFFNYARREQKYNAYNATPAQARPPQPTKQQRDDAFFQYWGIPKPPLD